MSLRDITVASTTRSGAKVITTEAQTWGQLKDSLRADFGDLEKMRAVVRETRNDLTSDDAVLPNENFTLLLTPKQIKAGAVDIVAVLVDVKERFSESIDDIISGIEDGDYNKVATKSDSVKSVTTSTSLAKTLEDLKNGNF